MLTFSDSMELRLPTLLPTPRATNGQLRPQWELQLCISSDSGQTVKQPCLYSTRQCGGHRVCPSQCASLVLPHGLALSMSKKGIMTSGLQGYKAARGPRIQLFVSTPSCLPQVNTLSPFLSCFSFVFRLPLSHSYRRPAIASHCDSCCGASIHPRHLPTS